MSSNQRKSGQKTTSSSSRKKSSRRRTAGTLKKHQTVDSGVIVEESFSLFSSSTSTSEGTEERVGDGVYVSTTIGQNKRYYGVLVDQASLKEASQLYFQEQRASMELNRRMSQLRKQQQGKEEENQPRPSPEGENNKASEAAEISRKSAATAGLVSDVSEPPMDSSSPASPADGTSKSPDNPSESHPAPKSQQQTVVITEVNEKPTAPSDDLKKRPVEDSSEQVAKRPRTDNDDENKESASFQKNENDLNIDIDVDDDSDHRSIQKFQYVDLPVTETNPSGEGYRVLLATFCNAKEAASHDAMQRKRILSACDRGGDFCGEYYYQYEQSTSVSSSSLFQQEGGRSNKYALTAQLPDKKQSGGSTLPTTALRMSLGFHSFLNTTTLPEWYPLANSLSADDQREFLSLLNMRRNNHGKLVYDVTSSSIVGPSSSLSSNLLLGGGTEVPMRPRSKRNQYRIGVVGGGIAGLACCSELLQQLELEGIEGKVVLLEARDRLGGRIHTDHDTFGIPVDLGAAWIHGIDHNPLAELAKEAGCDFVTTSEEVKMLGRGLAPVNSELDERMGKLFDDLLDLAADDCWAGEDIVKTEDSPELQKAVRWYSSVFADSGSNNEGNANPEAVGVPIHRKSSDRSIDFEVGKAIAKHKLQEFSKFCKDEHRMLLWNTKNIEYALGANISDLSMKYWDSDERHSFEGDHVLLKQGYSSIIQYLFDSLKRRGDERFECITNFPVGMIEYARKSSKLAYDSTNLRNGRTLIDLSDTCSVTSQDGVTTHNFDFVVCALPLGVLKESLLVSKDGQRRSDKVQFHPQLPFSKMDAISNVGFGLLDKVYLQFDTAFWRSLSLFQDEEQCLFGNASGINPHHYMFFDVGKTLGSKSPGNEPAVLMSLISGKEAVACEQLTEEELVDEVMKTLSSLFAPLSLPKPVATKITRWGKDKYSRGSYTFLPPGATDQDYLALQSPINGNGDSLVLEGNEKMRLFFAGEHTTSMHPSMSHGAMLSGIRAAKEVLKTMTGQMSSPTDKVFDRVVPMSMYRQKNPHAQLKCGMCNKIGSQVREGSLLCFQRGSRQVLVHSNCAEFSPEVEVDADGNWKHVLKAVTRGKGLPCVLCQKIGATIGCSQNCLRVYHVGCAEDTGWRFDRDGKIFHCDHHRKIQTQPGCDRISISYFQTKNPQSPVECSLCHDGISQMNLLGELLAFQSGFRQLCVHEKCIKYTNVCDTSEAEDEDNRITKEYRNVFEAVKQSSICSHCEGAGASIKCLSRDCRSEKCSSLYHFHCAQSTGWNFDKFGAGANFRCPTHRKREISAAAAAGQTNKPTTSLISHEDTDIGSVPPFQHHLLAHLGAMPSAAATLGEPERNKVESSAFLPTATETFDDQKHENIDSDENPDDLLPGERNYFIPVLDAVLSESSSLDQEGNARRTFRIERSSTNDPWDLHLKVSRTKRNDETILVLALAKTYQSDVATIPEGSNIVAINKTTVGSPQLHTLRAVLHLLRQETALTLETAVLPE